MSEHPVAVQVVRDLVQGAVKGELPDEHVQRVREILAELVGADDSEPVNNDTYSTTARAGLLSSWRRAANDPDDQPERWLVEGAPAGIRRMPEHRDVFPPVDDEADDPELFGTADGDYTYSTEQRWRRTWLSTSSTSTRPRST